MQYDRGLSGSDLLATNNIYFYLHKVMHTQTWKIGDCNNVSYNMVVGSWQCEPRKTTKKHHKVRQVHQENDHQPGMCSWHGKQKNEMTKSILTYQKNAPNNSTLLHCKLNRLTLQRAVSATPAISLVNMQSRLTLTNSAQTILDTDSHVYPITSSARLL